MPTAQTSYKFHCRLPQQTDCKAVAVFATFAARMDTCPGNAARTRLDCPCVECHPPDVREADLREDADRATALGGSQALAARSSEPLGPWALSPEVLISRALLRLLSMTNFAFGDLVMTVTVLVQRICNRSRGFSVPCSVQRQMALITRRRVAGRLGQRRREHALARGTRIDNSSCAVNRDPSGNRGSASAWLRWCSHNRCCWSSSPRIQCCHLPEIHTVFGNAQVISKLSVGPVACGKGRPQSAQHVQIDVCIDSDLSGRFERKTLPHKCSLQVMSSPWDLSAS